MIYNPEKHHRRSIRLKGYDYSQEGAYFVTICVQDRNCLFGDIMNDEMKLNNAGYMIRENWEKLPKRFKSIIIDEYIIMPNHLHGIIIVGADLRVCPDNYAINLNNMDNHHNPYAKISGEHVGSPLQIPVTLSRMIQWFKTITTNEYIRNIKKFNWPPFNKRLW